MTLFDVDIEVSISPTEGPVGTPITIEVKGIGWQTLEDTRTVMYDNQYVGFMSAVPTNGIARAVIPATGKAGPHQVQVLRGAYTFPYRNPAQSPRPDIPTFDFVFTVTDGEPVLPPDISEQNPELIINTDPPPSEGAWIATDMAAAPVGQPIVISGGDLEPNSDVELAWYRIVGNRVGGQGWDEQAVSVTTLTTDDDGAFTHEWAIPTDVGEVAAETWTSVLVSAEPLDVSVGEWGTNFEIRLSGVGWTETANIYAIVYDTYLGYACGFTSMTDNPEGRAQRTLPGSLTNSPGFKSGEWATPTQGKRGG